MHPQPPDDTCTYDDKPPSSGAIRAVMNDMWRGHLRGEAVDTEEYGRLGSKYAEAVKDEGKKRDVLS